METKTLAIRTLEDAIEGVYNRKGSEDLTLTEAIEEIKGLGVTASDSVIVRQIRKQIPAWF